jgi:hypothetical protein
MAKNVMTTAARDGARRYSLVDGTAANGIARCNQVLSAAGLTGASCSGSTPAGNPPAVSVTASYYFEVSVAGFIPGIPGTTLPLSSTTTMLKE